MDNLFLESPASAPSSSDSTALLPKKTNDPFFDKMMEYFNEMELKMHLKKGKSRLEFKRMKKRE